MKRMLYCMILLSATLSAADAVAQHADGRVLRSEFIPYDTRHDAVARDRQKIQRYVAYRPQATALGEGTIRVEEPIEIPYAWTDGLLFLHLENVGSAYTLYVNDREIGSSEDPFTPADFEITQSVREGVNRIGLELRESRTPELQEGIRTARPRFEGSYLFGQLKRSVFDFTARLVPDSLRRFGVLELEVVLRNGFNYPEAVTVGFDIYDPKGKLLEYNLRETTIDGRSTDTLRFAPYIYHTYENQWGVAGKAPLYGLTLYTKRDGTMREYIPTALGFTGIEFRDGRFFRFDRELTLRPASCNAAADRRTTAEAMRKLRGEGFDTLLPDAPQPDWYYDLADELGLYVIDRAAIAAPARRGDRTVGGTPSNDPRMADEYLARVKAMYYRSRNHPSVIAYELGGASGNGYAMYKAYEWLKSVEAHRPVIYRDADGEWNTDI